MDVHLLLVVGIKYKRDIRLLPNQQLRGRSADPSAGKPVYRKLMK